MRKSENRNVTARENTGFNAQLARADSEPREHHKASGGIVAACVALLRQGIAEIAAVRSSPRLGREEEKE